MPALDKQKRYAEEAAAAYKVFKERIEQEKALTREEKNARLEMFLDSHVSIFDEYYGEEVRLNRRLNNSEKLSDDASAMAKDIAALFGSSYTGRHFMKYRGLQGAAERARILDTHGRQLLNPDSRDGDARQSYMASSQANFDKMMRRTALIFNDRDPAVRAEMQAAGRRDAWASGPKRSPKQEAEDALTIAKARVAVLQSKLDQKMKEVRAAEAAVWRYLISAYSETLDADTRDVTIPYAVFLAKDESDPEDIRLLFFGEVMCYNLEDNILEMVSSTESSGAAHLKKTGDGFEVTSFDSVWDGTDYEKTAREIFGEHYEEFINLDDETKQAARKQNIRDYVKENGLDVTAYMDFDAEPVNLD